jgi:4-amino-4-deoxy-L-arabinose transferase-like glycosyltransferase
MAMRWLWFTSENAKQLITAIKEALTKAAKDHEVFVEGGILLLILGLGAFLRLENLVENPGWYSDEGTLLNIAHNLLQGDVRYLVINQSTLLVARLPLFPLILAGVSRYFGEGMQVLRTLTALLGLLSVGMCYLVVRRALEREGRWLALLSALMMAIYPQAVLYSRLGFSYNLLTPLVLLALLGCWEYLNRGRRAGLALAALALGVGSLSDLMILSLVVPVGVVVSSRRWRDMFWVLPLMALPFGSYVASMLIFVPQAFLFDLRFTLSRLGMPWLVQLPLVTLNFGALMIWDAWFAPAVIGLFMLRRQRWQRLCLLFFMLPLIFLGRTAGLTGLGFYYISPLFPLVAIGMASLVRFGTPHVFKFIFTTIEDFANRWKIPGEWRFGRWVKARGVALLVGVGSFLVLVAPFLISTFLTFFQVRNGFRTAIDWVLVEPKAASHVARVVNQISDPDDLVIASPALVWSFETQTADFQLALAAQGVKTEHFPANIPRDRFVVDPRLEQARYVVIDRIWRNWAAPAMPGVATMITQIEGWPLVMAEGEFEVYRNPAR